MSDRILTLHPDGKQGTNISREKYEAMRATIEDLLRANGTLTFRALGDAVEKKLDGTFEGSVGWYYTTVKLDLEARGVIERVGRGSPQRLRLRDRDT
jgi:hypothetical protein